MSKPSPRQITAFEFARLLEKRFQEDPCAWFGEGADEVCCQRMIDFRHQSCQMRFLTSRKEDATCLITLAVQLIPQSKTNVAFKCSFTHAEADPMALPILLIEEPDAAQRHVETTMARLGSYVSRLRREGYLTDLEPHTPEPAETASPTPEEAPTPPALAQVLSEPTGAQPAPESPTPPTPEPDPDKSEPAETEEEAPPAEKYVPEMDPDFPVRVRSE